MSLPKFSTFTQSAFQSLQQQWAAKIDPVIKTFNGLNKQPPQISIFTALRNGIYTVPSGIFYLEILMVGAGGGGAASGTSIATAATAGTNTSFGVNLLQANGGGLGASEGAGGTGGIASIGNLKGIALAGGSGQGYAETVTITTALSPGGNGGISFFGGAGGGGSPGLPGFSASPNSGSGGGGGGPNNQASDFAGSGGGAGGFVHAFITQNIQSSYPYLIGIGGAGGTSAAQGANGGAGANGLIIVKAFFQ